MAVLTSLTRGLSFSRSLSAVTDDSGSVVVAALARPALNSSDRPSVKGERRQGTSMDTSGPGR
ncbi:hypothetical protein D3C81_1781580 [compost metagenome]